MATDSAVQSVTNTLTSTTADTITLTQKWDYIEITNWDTSVTMYFRQDGTTAVADADNTIPVFPLQSVRVKFGNGTISVVGNANKYTVAGLAA